MDPTTLPRENGFRLRGAQVTRLETFVDAAFFRSVASGVPYYPMQSPTASRRLLWRSTHSLSRWNSCSLERQTG